MPDRAVYQMEQGKDAIMKTRFDALLEPALFLATAALFGLSLLVDVQASGPAQAGQAAQLAQATSAECQRG